MSVTDWSPQPSGNAVADRAIPARDGMAGREVPQAIRGIMARIAALALDQGGALRTEGTANAFVVNTASGIGTLRAGLRIVVRPDRTNTDAATLNVDGSGPKPWLNAAGTALPPGTISQDRVLTTTYDPALDAWTIDSGLATAAVDVAYPADIVNTFARSLDEKARERAKSFLDYMPLSVRNGYRTGTVVDLTPYLQKALDSGRDLFMPPNLPKARITSYLQQTTPRQVVDWACSTQLLYDAPPGSAITPAWIIREMAEGAVVRGLNVDHQGEGARYVAPTMGGTSISFGNALLLMADRSRADGCIVFNAWDSGIGVGRSSLTALQQFNGQPVSATVSGAQTFNCGVGFHPGGEQAGGGVNILCGSRTLVIDCTDVGSLTGFIGDYASGAGGAMIACRSIAAKTSVTPYEDTPAHLIGGFGFYLGANHLTVIGCSADDAARIGFWVDGYGFDVHLKGCRAKGCREQGLLLQGGYNSAEGFIADFCSYLNQGTYPAIEVRGTWVDGPDQASVGLVVSNPTTRGPYHHTGVLVTAGDSRPASGQLIGGFLNGTLAAFNRGTQATFNAAGWRNAGVNALQSAGIQILAASNRSAASDPFGDSGNNGNLILSDEADPRKRVAMGYDPVRDRGVVQAIQATIASKPLEMNPSGGPVLAGKAGPAQNDANNLFYVPSMGGPPTAAPPAIPGMVPFVFDAANARMYAWFGGVWKTVGFA